MRKCIIVVLFLLSLNGLIFAEEQNSFKDEILEVFTRHYVDDYSKPANIVILNLSEHLEIKKSEVEKILIEIIEQGLVEGATKEDLNNASNIYILCST